MLPADAPRGLCPRCLALTAAGDFLGGPAGSPKAEHPLLHYFGDYELLEEIARGGMGVVYHARQVSLNRPVAVKMILAGLFANEAERKRFKVEAETAARLNHPNIVEIYEVGEHEGHQYFSMRLVEGASLAERVRSAEFRVSSVAEAEAGELPPAPKPLSIAESVRVMAKAARAVHFAHKRGVLHRDLKPGNILLDDQGEPHITDFGLARLIEGDSDLTLSGAVLGSPAYMSPEQAAGRATHLTPAADIYALGAVLYFLLAGQPPFNGATPVETVRRVVDAEPPSPRRLNPRLDADLETICLKCLEKDPQRRYGSAEALAEDLERWLRQEPILARPTQPWESVAKWARRNPLVAALVLLIIVGVVSQIVTVLWLSHQAEVARLQAGGKKALRWQSVSGSRVQAEPNSAYKASSPMPVEIVLPSSAELGDVVLVQGAGSGGWRIQQNPGQSILTENCGVGVPGRVWVRHEFDRDWRHVSSSADGNKLAAVEFGYPRGGGWIYLSENGGQTWKLRGRQAFWLSVASSADATRLVAGAYFGPLSLSTNSGLTWAPVAKLGNWSSVAASADGLHWVASDAGTNGGGHIHTSQDGGFTWVAGGSAQVWMSVCSSADGRRLAAVHGMLDPDTNAPGGYPYVSQDGGASWHSTLREQGRRWSSVACSADGAKLLACVYEGGLYTSTNAGATWRQHLTDAAHRWWRVACSADGSLMSAKGCDGEIFLSRDGGSQWEASLLDTPNCGSLTTSADGQRLVAITGVSTSKLIAVSAPSTTPGPSTQISGDASSQIQLAYAGSNQFRILNLSGPVRIEGLLVRPSHPSQQTTPR